MTGLLISITKNNEGETYICLPLLEDNIFQATLPDGRKTYITGTEDGVRYVDPNTLENVDLNENKALILKGGLMLATTKGEAFGLYSNTSTIPDILTRVERIHVDPKPKMDRK